MSPTSYQTAPPRDMNCFNRHQRHLLIYINSFKSARPFFKIFYPKYNERHNALFWSETPLHAPGYHTRTATSPLAFVPPNTALESGCHIIWPNIPIASCVPPFISYFSLFSIFHAYGRMHIFRFVQSGQPLPAYAILTQATLSGLTVHEPTNIPSSRPNGKAVVDCDNGLFASIGLLPLSVFQLLG
jgi:hypothetical protein